jgi:hypothetical protein
VRSLAFEFSDYPTGQGDPDRDFELEEKKYMAAPVERASSVAKVPPSPHPHRHQFMSIYFRFYCFLLFPVALYCFPLLLLSIIAFRFYCFLLLLSASIAFYYCFPLLLLSIIAFRFYCFLLLLSASFAFLLSGPWVGTIVTNVDHGRKRRAKRDLW